MVSASTSRPAPASAPRIALSRLSRSQYPAVTAPPRARAGTGRRDYTPLATNSLTGVKPSSTRAPGYSEVGEKMVGRDGIEPPTPGFSVLAVNPRIVRHFIELCLTARGASSRHVAVGCSLEQSVSDNLGDSHRVPATARSKMTLGSGCRHRHARDGLRSQPTARTRATRPSLVS